MQNKPRSRTDVQWVISSISLAVTLGLWALFVGNEKRGAGVAAQVAFTSPPDQVIVTQTQTQPQLLAPGQVLLFGGTAPQTQQTVTTQTITQTRSRRGGGGGGGGGAVTSTGSSKP